MQGIKGFQIGHGRLRDAASYLDAGKKISAAKMGKKHPKIAGPLHYLWTGRTPLIETIRKCLEYRQWREAVFKRDNYTCTLCGALGGGDKHADHIKQFAFIIRENKLKSLADALVCTELWDINNGRTLCIPCHKAQPVYAYNGKRDVTFKMRQ